MLGLWIAGAIAAVAIFLFARGPAKNRTLDRIARRESELLAESGRIAAAVVNAEQDGDIEYVKKCRVRAGCIAKEFELLKHERRDAQFGVSVASINTAGSW